MAFACLLIESLFFHCHLREELNARYATVSPVGLSATIGLIDQRLQYKTIKHLEEIIGVNLHNLGFGNAFLYMTPKV